MVGISTDSDLTRCRIKGRPLPIAEVALEFRIDPTLTRRAVVVSVRPNIKVRALHTVLPDSVWSHAEPANSFHRGLSQIKLHAKHVQHTVELVLVIELQYAAR